MNANNLSPLDRLIGGLLLQPDREFEVRGYLDAGGRDCAAYLLVPRNLESITYRLDSVYASIDEVVDKLGAQLRKLKERKVNHKFGDQPRVRAVARKAPRAEDHGMEVVRPKLEALTVEEAVETLNAEKLPLLMYINALSGSIQVLQRLSNGKLSLIDPASDRARVAHGRA